MDVVAGLSDATSHSWAIPHAVSEAPPGPGPPPPTPAARLINDDDAPPPAPLTTATPARVEEPGVEPATSRVLRNIYQNISKFSASVQSPNDSRVVAAARALAVAAIAASLTAAATRPQTAVREAPPAHPPGVWLEIGKEKGSSKLLTAARSVAADDAQHGATVELPRKNQYPRRCVCGCSSTPGCRRMVCPGCGY